MKKLIFILILIFLNSCTIFDASKKEEGVKDKKNVKKYNYPSYLDVKKSSTWVYDAEIFSNKKEMTVTIKKTENGLIDDRNRVYILDDFGYRNNDFYYIKFPLKKNNTWVNKYNGIVEIAMIEDANLSVDFNGKKYNSCVKVSYLNKVEQAGNYIKMRIFCPGLWIVSQESFFENQAKIATKQNSYKLKSYKED